MGRFGNGVGVAAAGHPGKQGDYAHLAVRLFCVCIVCLRSLCLPRTESMVGVSCMQIEEQRREWERTKDELGRVKKHAAEKVSASWRGMGDRACVCGAMTPCDLLCRMIRLCSSPRLSASSKKRCRRKKKMYVECRAH